MVLSAYRMGNYRRNKRISGDKEEVIKKPAQETFLYPKPVYLEIIILARLSAMEFETTTYLYPSKKMINGLQHSE